MTESKKITEQAQRKIVIQMWRAYNAQRKPAEKIKLTDFIFMLKEQRKRDKPRQRTAAT